MKLRKDLSNNDRAFSDWLFANGWKGDTLKTKTGTYGESEFLNSNEPLS